MSIPSEASRQQATDILLTHVVDRAAERDGEESVGRAGGRANRGLDLVVFVVRDAVADARSDLVRPRFLVYHGRLDGDVGDSRGADRRVPRALRLFVSVVHRIVVVDFLELDVDAWALPVLRRCRALRPREATPPRAGRPARVPYRRQLVALAEPSPQLDAGVEGDDGRREGAQDASSVPERRGRRRPALPLAGGRVAPLSPAGDGARRQREAPLGRLRQAQRRRRDQDADADVDRAVLDALLLGLGQGQKGAGRTEARSETMKIKMESIRVNSLLE